VTESALNFLQQLEGYAAACATAIKYFAHSYVSFAPRDVEESGSFDANVVILTDRYENVFF
jgi:hypothetical protein